MLQVIQHIDKIILLWIQEYCRLDILTPFIKWVTSLGDRGFIWILLIIIFLITKKYRKTGIKMLCSLVLSTLIVNILLKNIVMRIRPYEVITELQLLIGKQVDFSFPSGHASSSFASAGILFYYNRYPWGIIAIIIATLIAFSRLYVGVHYPSDVIAGIIIGLFSCSIIIWINKKKKLKEDH